MPERSEFAVLAAALMDPERPTPNWIEAPTGEETRRLAVYRNNLAVGLGDALAASFPAVRALVGEAFFQATARGFVRAHPPRSPVLSRWGEPFADWLATFAPAAGVAYLPDVARLEWAWLQAYHAVDVVPLEITALAGLPAEALETTRLRLHPSHAIVASRFPIASLWAQTTGREPPTGLDLGTAQTVLIVRPDSDVEVRIVRPATATLVRALRDGLPLGEAFAGARTDPEFEPTPELLTLFTGGLVVGLAPPSPRSPSP